jgi:hypothetical protein
MEGKSSMESGSGWFILLCAHDHVWRDHGWTVAERMAASKILWELSIQLCSGLESVTRRI